MLSTGAVLSFPSCCQWRSQCSDADIAHDNDCDYAENLNYSSSRRELSWCRQTTRTRSRQRIRNNNSNSSSRVTARWTRTIRRRGTSSMRITTTAAGTTTNRGRISTCLWLHSSLDRYSYKILSI